MVAEHKTYTLGPLPWSDADLIAATWRNGQQVQSWLDEHPGRELEERLVSIRSALRIFKGAAAEFNHNLERFAVEAKGGNIFRRNRWADLKAIEDRVQEVVYLFASSAMTLVDQTRTLSERVSLDGYQERVDASFLNNPLHRFVQELRVDVIHVTLHRPGWSVTHGDEAQSSFKLWPSQLSRLKKYNANARRFVEQYPEGIDLGTMIHDYQAQVLAFHEWLHAAVLSAVGDQLADYKRCARTVRAVASRSWWNLIIRQVVIDGKRDPYNYLDQWLTPEELAEVLSLPKRSREQVDRIIALVDDDGACDDALRANVYVAFGVASDA